jgi:hypothetical protein
MSRNAVAAEDDGIDFLLSPIEAHVKKKKKKCQ